MQVARNVYLSSEKDPTHAQALRNLADLQAGAHAGKDQILEIYMNQIFSVTAAMALRLPARCAGKPLKDITVAEAAMLAGLPKAPSAYNPISNPKRARSRQLYIIERMQDNGFITAEQALSAKAQELRLRKAPTPPAPMLNMPG